MGDLTLEEMRDEVKANLGRLNSAVDNITDTRYNRNIHLAQLRIARAGEWTELRQDTSADVVITGTLLTDKYYDLGSAVKYVHSVRLTYESETRPPLIYVPQRQWDAYTPAAEEEDTGRPSHYTRWERRIEFWKIPGANYTIQARFVDWPTELTDDAHTSDLSQKDDMIVTLTTSVLLRQLAKIQDANTYFGIYNAMLKEAKTSDAYKPDISLVSRGVGDAASNRWPGTDYWADPFVKGMP